jgi:hypothetical protein
MKAWLVSLINYEYAQNSILDVVYLHTAKKKK